MGPRTTAPTALLIALLPAALGLAQDPPPERPVPIDQVIATVGDAAILRSTVDQAAAGEIRSREQELGRPLTDNELAIVRTRVLQRLIDQHCLAQAAKTLGVFPPSRIEEMFQEELKKIEREQVRQLGSMQRFSQELRDQRKTWDTFAREQRLETMSSLTEQFAVYGRLNNQRNLFITPRMMRDFYRANRDLLYVYGPQARLGSVAFLVRGDAAASLEQARQAADTWRAEDLSSAELAARFPGARPQPDEVGIGSPLKSGLKATWRDFALGNPTGTVSDPIREGDVIWVLKVLEQLAGRDSPFEDEAVQADIRRRLEQQVVELLKTQAILRSRLRTHVWIAQ